MINHLIYTKANVDQTRRTNRISHSLLCYPGCTSARKPPAPVTYGLTRVWGPNFAHFKIVSAPANYRASLHTLLTICYCNVVSPAKSAVSITLQGTWLLVIRLHYACSLAVLKPPVICFDLSRPHLNASVSCFNRASNTSRTIHPVVA